MSLVKAHLPCPMCDSSDAYSIYEDGHGYCFSCTAYIKNEKDEPEEVYSQEYLAWRGVSAQTMQFYGMASLIDTEGRPVILKAPYAAGTKYRRLDRKEFWSENLASAQLFGKDKFSPGMSKSITICEGELDAASVYQMLGSKYPVVSVRNAATAKGDCTAEREYLNSFERIYLCFDNDEAGNKALSKVAALFDFNKVYHVKLSLKDANEYLTGSREREFISCWYNARRFLPEGIHSTFNDFEKIIKEGVTKKGQPYPFPTLQKMTDGARLGEIVLVTALEGIGKTEIIGTIEHAWLKSDPEANIGVIHLEEGKERTLKRYSGYELEYPVHKTDCPYTNEEIMEHLKRVVVKDDRLHLYSHFGSSDPDVILDTIRFLASACECKYIFLDHISMVVSGLNDSDERKTLDYISTRLAMMVQELNFCLVLVSHVNDDGLTRGSRNISKIAHVWIHLHRDLMSDNEVERNTTHLLLKKNRPASMTGSAGKLIFDPATYIIKEKQLDLPVKEAA